MIYVIATCYVVPLLFLLVRHIPRFTSKDPHIVFTSLGICFGWPLIILAALILIPLFYVVELIDRLAYERDKKAVQRSQS